MSRTMYDAVTPANIPASATMVAGYVDGRYANIGALKKRFPNARLVTIAVTHTSRAMVADVETGDMSPETAVLWCTETMHDVPNSELTIYANTSTWPSVVAAFRTAEVSLPQWWAARYDGLAELPAGAVTKQYESPSLYDVSVVADYWPGVDPAPEPPKVSLNHVIAAAKKDPGQAQGHTTYKADVLPVERALVAEHLLDERWVDGSFGTLTLAAYSAWQKDYSAAHGLGWTGAAVNGIPGDVSLRALGAKHGFTVVS